MTHQYDGRRTPEKSSLENWNCVARSVTPTCVNCRFDLRATILLAPAPPRASFCNTILSADHCDSGGASRSTVTNVTRPNPQGTLATTGCGLPASLITESGRPASFLNYPIHRTQRTGRISPVRPRWTNRV